MVTNSLDGNTPTTDQQHNLPIQVSLPAGSTYEYIPLPGLDWLRLLTLMPGKENNKLQCRIHALPILEAEDAYEAVSYTWGDSRKAASIICHNRELPITNNLANALKQLHDPTKPRLLWIDAICINQGDGIEKGHQVKRMGNMYQSAKRVIVWLGLDLEEIAQDSFQLVQGTNRYLDGLYEKSKDGPHGQCRHSCCIPTLVPPFPICSDSQRWAKVNRMVNLHWFKRLWVIQEAGLAKECVLLWGGQTMEFAEIVELAFWVGYRADLGTLIGGTDAIKIGDIFVQAQCTYRTPKTWHQILPLINSRKRIRQQGTMLFADVLVAGKSTEVTDRRDRVYAFLGSPLAMGIDGELMVSPDYSELKSAEDVYFETACALLQHPREAPWVLSRVYHQLEDHVAGRDIPSWVPRWDETPNALYLASPRHWYHAGGRRNVFKPQIKKEGKLSLFGFVFDRLSWLSEPLRKQDFSLDSTKWDAATRSTCIPLIDSLWKKLLGQLSDIPLSSIEHSFGLTLVREYANNKDGLTRLDKHRADFHEYRRLIHATADPNSVRLPDESIPSSHAPDPHYYQYHVEYCDNRRLAITDNGRIGLTLPFARPGDICCIFPGLSVPFVLRENVKGCYNLVGDVYLHGVMRGEMMGELGRGMFELETIVLG